MKKCLEQLKENKWIHYLVILIIGIIISIPLKDVQISETDDGFFHLLRLIGTHDTILIGQIPPIIVPDYCSTTGYAMNLFYPPLVTYIPLLIKLVTPSYVIALKVFGALCIILSGITMYNFTYQVTKKRTIALFSAIIYLIAPYKLGNVYKRYAIGEFTALVFVPIVFQGLYNLFREDGKKHYYIAIGASLLMLSHTLTTFYTAIFCAIYIVFYLNKLKDKEIIKKMAINVIFILLITIMFWYPMIEAKSDTQYAVFDNCIMNTNCDFAQENSLELSEFFKYVRGENATTYIIGIPVVILLIFSFYAIRKIDTKYKDLYVIFVLLAFISIYMTTKYFPWKFMPNLICKLQFPWRMMGFFNFFTSFICAINLYIIINKFTKKNSLKAIVVLILIIISIGNTLPLVNQYKSTDETKDEEYEKSILNNTKISFEKINKDYLPVRSFHYQNKKQNKTDVLYGMAQVLNEVKDKLTTNIDITNATKDTILEFPYLYYPGYKVTIIMQDRVEEIKPIESEHGYLAIKLPNNIEKGQLKVEYKGTIITKVSYLISLISIIIFIGYIIKEKNKK